MSAPPPSGENGLVPARSGEGGWSRNEWDVALTTGAVCRVFQDLTTDGWFLEGIYD